MVELNANFTDKEIEDLKLIVEFFKDEMCLHMDSDFRTCYERTPHDYLMATGNRFWTNIDFDEQKKLYQKISDSAFEAIWVFCESTFYPSKVKADEICFVAMGRYQQYLTDLGKTNPRIAQYAERIQASGDFFGLDIQYSEVLKDKKSFDLDDPNIQLILAIHYLSLNDQAKRNADLIQDQTIMFE
ncbi:hypothetical protein [Cyclobacterium sp.]|uniref:hypothetical protein n=1 Tax=Cyclobacterium sp. TaxID=1966343 RepID=UPI0019B461B5|nr:hypothetical protein [Cyclobacterium sp.]MBD3630480.1 hypothetical protein [Cyclobacterium sp.]